MIESPPGIIVPTAGKFEAIKYSLISKTEIPFVVVTFVQVVGLSEFGSTEPFVKA